MIQNPNVFNEGNNTIAFPGLDGVPFRGDAIPTIKESDRNRPQETLDAEEQQEWGIKRVTLNEEDAPDEDVLMDVYPTEEEANWAAFKLNESEADSDVSYEAFKM